MIHQSITVTAKMFLVNKVSSLLQLTSLNPSGIVHDEKNQDKCINGNLTST